MRPNNPPASKITKTAPIESDAEFEARLEAATTLDAATALYNELREKRSEFKTILGGIKNERFHRGAAPIRSGHTQISRRLCLVMARIETLGGSVVVERPASLG